MAATTEYFGGPAVVYPNLSTDVYAALQDPTQGMFPTHNAAGMLMLAVSPKDKHVYVQMVRQHKKGAETKQWDDTLSIPSGKRAPHPDKTNKKTGKPYAEMGSAEYTKLLVQYNAEELNPMQTAVREAVEETGAPAHEIRAKFNDSSLCLLNNGYTRFMADQQKVEAYKNKKEMAPFICATYATFQVDHMKEELWDPNTHDSDETSAVMWVQLDGLLPTNHEDQQSDFFKNVFVNNKNWAVPKTCATLPADAAQGTLKVASYVTRTLSNGYKEIMAAANAFAAQNGIQLAASMPTATPSTDVSASSSLTDLTPSSASSSQETLTKMNDEKVNESAANGLGLGGMVPQPSLGDVTMTPAMPTLGSFGSFNGMTAQAEQKTNDTCLDRAAKRLHEKSHELFKTRASEAAAATIMPTKKSMTALAYNALLAKKRKVLSSAARTGDVWDNYFNALPQFNASLQNTPFKCSCRDRRSCGKARLSSTTMEILGDLMSSWHKFTLAEYREQGTASAKKHLQGITQSFERLVKVWRTDRVLPQTPTREERRLRYVLFNYDLTEENVQSFAGQFKREDTNALVNQQVHSLVPQAEALVAKFISDPDSAAANRHVVVRWLGKIFVLMRAIRDFDVLLYNFACLPPLLYMKFVTPSRYMIAMVLGFIDPLFAHCQPTEQRAAPLLAESDYLFAEACALLPDVRERFRRYKDGFATSRLFNNAQTNTAWRPVHELHVKRNSVRNLEEERRLGVHHAKRRRGW